jgi:hypothetical protein
LSHGQSTSYSAGGAKHFFLFGSAASAVAAFGTVKVAAAEGNPPITALKYWNGRGLMDTPRMMLAMTGRPFKVTSSRAVVWHVLLC